jgi:hypothetical protein
MQINHAALDQQPHQRDRNQSLPAQTHDLVEAVARKCRAQPQKGEHGEQGLQAEPEKAGRGQPCIVGQQTIKRRQPAAEKENDRQRRNQIMLTYGGEKNAKAMPE